MLFEVVILRKTECMNPPEGNFSSIIKVDGSDKYFSGDKVSYECKEGYNPEYGTVLSQLTCRINGTWDSTKAPDCLESIKTFCSDEKVKKHHKT